MSVLWLLVGCGGEWTTLHAVEPTLAKLDVDHDGRVTAGEYDRVTFSGPAFAKVDVDGDGALSSEELLTLVLHQDPQRFYQRPGQAQVVPPALPDPRTANVGWCVLESMRQEVLAANPGAVVPTADETWAAAQGGGPALLAMRDRLDAALVAEGLPVPPRR